MSEKLKKLLYVEDDESIAEVTIMVLEDFSDLEVKHCSNGIDALAALSEFQPQMVLMDVMMPEMDGPQTLNKMRETDIGKNLPIVFITAKAQTDEQRSYIRLGATGVITKPYDPITLPQQIEELWWKANAN